mmetsp:Transcript_2373/g.5514  ORF Transcript_2373/g.5514 Transcript_2373/m.5514 type:complete len:141 (+) Transcript_2373:143-565(+)
MISLPSSASLFRERRARFACNSTPMGSTSSSSAKDGWCSPKSVRGIWCVSSPPVPWPMKKNVVGMTSARNEKSSPKKVLRRMSRSELSSRLTPHSWLDITQLSVPRNQCPYVFGPFKQLRIIEGGRIIVGRVGDGTVATM